MKLGEIYNFNMNNTDQITNKGNIRKQNDVNHSNVDVSDKNIVYDQERGKILVDNFETQDQDLINKTHSPRSIQEPNQIPLISSTNNPDKKISPKHKHHQHKQKHQQPILKQQNLHSTQHIKSLQNNFHDLVQQAALNHKKQKLQTQSMFQFSSEISFQDIFQWKNFYGQLKTFDIMLGIKKITTQQIFKIKSLTQQGIQGFRKIKISSNFGQEIVFALEYQRIQRDLPLQYLWFSMIVCNKLKLLDYHFDKIKPLNQQIKCQQLRVHIPNIICQGNICKKSQFKGSWVQRFIVINQQGLYSYKSQTQTTPSFIIKANSVKYIWTRFQIYKNQLVIKIKHGFDKTQFSIPIQNYSHKFDHNWLYAFYTLTMKKHKFSQNI